MDRSSASPNSIEPSLIDGAVDRRIDRGIDGAGPTGTIFPAHRRYRFYFVGGVGLTLLFTWEVVRRFSPELAIFLGMSLIIALWSARKMGSRVELTPIGVTLHTPFSPAQHLDFRQLLSAGEEGRRSKIITLIYYPVGGDGLLDLQNPLTLFLPEVEEQERLMAIIHREMPPV